jgi:hypothetical protein
MKDDTGRPEVDIVCEEDRKMLACVDLQKLNINYCNNSEFVCLLIPLVYQICSFCSSTFVTGVNRYQGK